MSDSKIKILLVDDDPLIVGLYEKVFRRAGYDVETAFDGKEALEMLKKMSDKPTLIMMDVMMPIMNGLDALKKLKQDPELKNFKTIPVVMLTNLAGEEDAERALTLGAVTYLIKSEYEAKEIVEKVKEILSGYTRDRGIPEVKVPIKDIDSKK